MRGDLDAAFGGRTPTVPKDQLYGAVLESLTIRDFQCYEKERIDFDERITVIVGPTDSGKSSWLRALRWLATNRPSGDGFVRRLPREAQGNSRGVARAVLRFDGHTAERVRGPGRNLYKLDGRVFKSFGAGVPEEIISLLALGPENFAGQHDAPFWFMLSPGEVSRELNGIVNLGLIDSTLANLAAELRRARTRIEVIEERVKEAQERTSRLSWARDADRDLSRVEAMGVGLEKRRGRIAGLRGLLGKLGEASLATRNSRAVLPLADKMEASWQAKEMSKKAASDLVASIRSAKEANDRRANTSREAEEVEAELKQIAHTKCPVCGRGPENFQRAVDDLYE